ncbi:restriction endonuclease subunit S [Actinoplanes sp. NPDC026619]|uniref:restriction endonuclease subunit S n=1 Tax=Actinoplanes sp. NPDC026619 TaxID=3155798 RepID=UPI00340813B4
MTTGLAGLELPVGWQWRPLKHAVRAANRGSAPDYVDDGPVWAVSQAVNQPNRLDWDRARFHGGSRVAGLKGLLAAEDILINSTGRGTLGRVGYFTGSPDDRPAMADGHVTRVRANTEILHPRFGFYYFSSEPFQHYIYSALIVGATNQIELVGERLGSAPVAIPPMEEQRRIADFLDAQVGKFERLRAALASADALAREHRISVINGVWDFDSPSVRLGYRVSLATSGSRSWSELVGESGDVFFRSANLRRDGINPNLTSVVYVDPPAKVAVEAGRARIRCGDVLIGITGANTGWISLAGPSVAGGYVSQHVCLVRPAAAAHAQWLAYVMSSTRVQQSLFASQYGGTKTQLSLPDVRNIRIPVHPTDVQQLTAKRIENEIGRIDSLRVARNRQSVLLEERLNALITGVVTGQIDVTTARGVD